MGVHEGRGGGVEGHDEVWPLLMDKVFSGCVATSSPDPTPRTTDTTSRVTSCSMGVHEGRGGGVEGHDEVWPLLMDKVFSGCVATSSPDPTPRTTDTTSRVTRSTSSKTS